MVVIWGVATGNKSETLVISWDACMAKCWEEASCVVISETTTGCDLYRFGFLFQVDQTDGVNGGKVGVKRILDTCSPISNTTETYTSETILYQYNISQNQPNSWSFSYDYYIECPTGSFASIRGANRVCIMTRVFPNPYCLHFNNATAMCTKDGAMGLTGPYSRAEAEVIADHISLATSAAPITGYTILNFWVDGTRIPPGDYTMTDDTLNGTSGYNWQNPAGTWDSAFIVRLDGVVWVYHNAKENYNYPGGMCLRGGVCRIKPITGY
ncbi:hypothetical protein CAEBREN_08347 [Caenorhabditis brenneri]|uniref:PAN-3 domain-containing protein n=1 Tax=Caenorhabditis brenneri TaxID=135651 RepID=G0NCK4_CAEBE|nr:hypothetical protein CAEBREN_08347 [Caenorhabditis brenneri]